MITIVFTYRNREISTVEKCLNSLAKQTVADFKVVVVDYGSEIRFATDLKQLIELYDFVELISCPVQGQLWNKSRAINMALQQATTPYFFVGDIDMLFRDDFIEKLYALKSDQTVVYFQVGVLSQTESKLNKVFQEYLIKHKTNEEATGMTLFPTAVLKSIQGYDEFYHGWGAEDTDVHIRLQLAGYKIHFFDETILMLHQWHPKKYRSKQSKEPFHSNLEQINHQYLQKIAIRKDYVANTVFGWGTVPETVDFNNVKPIKISLTNQLSEVGALLYGLLEHYRGECIVIEIEPHQEYNSFKNSLKKVIGKKSRNFYNFQTINDLLLAQIISRFRDKYYSYEWNKQKNRILLKIAL
ncbi:glycosyltransferase family 2 protein [Flavobacterium sp. UMI-01]|uniref:glycosyltransferase family 2 protein n=1 Tax=Flavobacterium sp. UMI-01 TaxID=1441053 RepID=UPI001C7CC4BA|nr:glycosyltransferase [Flavobacterium sp. UMI-01]GIZ07455.1 hypothetical protein FUMI01_01820 [Flavobacterium sp. UMI-01]